jgi:hypothetical protein
MFWNAWVKVTGFMEVMYVIISVLRGVEAIFITSMLFGNYYCSYIL